MKLVKLKCPSCNANLEVNSAMKQFTCNYCGTTTLLDDETININANIKTQTRLEKELEELQDIIDGGNEQLSFETARLLLKKYPNNENVRKVCRPAMNSKYAKAKLTGELFNAFGGFIISTIGLIFILVILYFLITL